MAAVITVHARTTVIGIGTVIMTMIDITAGETTTKDDAIALGTVVRRTTQFKTVSANRIAVIENLFAYDSPSLPLLG
jgi:hypothetical protein